MNSLANRTAAIVVGCLAISGTCSAVDWTWKPQGRVVSRLEDNIGTSSHHTIGAWGFDTTGSVDLKGSTETVSSELIPRANFRRFVIGDNLDADEYGVAFNNKWNRELFGAGLDFSYNRDSTLVTEANDQIVENVGRTARDVVKNRDSLTVQPTFSYAVSERLVWQNTFLYNDVAYKDAAATGLIDYSYWQAQSGFNFQWKNSLSVFSDVRYSVFEVPDLESETRSVAGEVGAKWAIDETLEASATVGWIQSAIDFVEIRQEIVLNPTPQVVLLRVPGSASSGGPIASVSIKKAFDLILTKFDFSREVSPSGRGSQSTSDHFALNVTRPISERLRILLDGFYEMRAAQAENLSNGLSARGLNRDYFEIKGSVRYLIQKEWTLGATYRYGYRESTQATGNDVATTNAIYLTLDYNGLERAFGSGL